ERVAYLPARLSILPCPAAGCVEPPTEPEPEPEFEPEPVPGCACTTAAVRAPVWLLLWPLAFRRRRFTT
ncbi:MAG TPA: hypothetical protein VK034_15990, partial [Enhygromyxa sp.]|nr:hypothetical protein [Enhygromyxa sp.]